MANDNSSRDLVLAPGEYAYVLDTTKGLVNTIVGSNKISMSNTDQPVVWNKVSKRFDRADLDKAIQINTIAPEGFYIALFNPAEPGTNIPAHPRESASSTSIPLSVGHRVNIPGPANFPLWPGQMAEVIKGHHLRSNQYLLAQVYNDAEATKNWKSAVLKPQGIVTTETEVSVVSEPRSFVPGQLLVIKGTEVAFFIPPTGIKVVPEPEKSQNYVRDAVTLERLEYCILLDEDGNKRFVQGPDVVFPEPTEKFVLKKNDEGELVRKFKAIELNETTGLYIKVIAPYKDEKGREYKIGEELFLTGKDMPIYFQREEHSIIRYGNQTKHYAVALPAGEGRYVLNRLTGVVDLVTGPKMLLCDPREYVIVRRILDEKTAALWYPNNKTVIEVNKNLDTENKQENVTQYAMLDSAVTLSHPATAGMSYVSNTVNQASRQIAGDMFTRGKTFTPPRTITLDTKYEGAVGISVWAGYAVQVVNKTGGRRVVVGPQSFLLAYDETLTQLELSTQTPKTDKNTIKTVYLQVKNNKVSDKIRVETRDLVNVDLLVSYRVNFEGENSHQWFEVENYVKLLCDHMRSMIRNAAKRRNIEDFYTNAIDVIRDTVLGLSKENSRPGQQFVENQMHVYDVEVLDITIPDKAVSELMLNAQKEALTSAILLSKHERALQFTTRVEEINRETAKAQSLTVLAKQEVAKAEVLAQLDVSIERVNAEAKTETLKLSNKLEDQTKLRDLTLGEIERNKARDNQRLETKKAEIELEIQRIVGETTEIVKRAEAVDDKLATALVAFSDQALIERISTSLAPMAAMNGVSAADILAQLFGGTPFEGVMKQLGTRTRMPVSVNLDE